MIGFDERRGILNRAVFEGMAIFASGRWLIVLIKPLVGNFSLAKLLGVFMVK